MSENDSTGIICQKCNGNGTVTVSYTNETTGERCEGAVFECAACAGIGKTHEDILPDILGIRRKQFAEKSPRWLKIAYFNNPGLHYEIKMWLCEQQGDDSFEWILLHVMQLLMRENSDLRAKLGMIQNNGTNPYDFPKA